MKFFRFDRTTGDIEIVAEKPQLPSVTKGELVALIAGELGMTKTDVDAVVKCLLAAIGAGLKSGRPVVLAGFGRFRPRKCRSGKARNPRTGKVVKATGRPSVTFRPSTRLRQRLE